MIPARNSVAAINAMRSDTPEGVFAYQLNTCTPRQFDKLVIAEAYGGAPASLSRVLLLARHRDDLLDSLSGAECRLQVSLMRQLYISGPTDRHAVSLRTGLTAVRARLKWLRENRLPDDSLERHHAQKWAFNLLRKAHRAEYDRILAVMRQRYGVVEPVERMPKDADLAAWMQQAGFACPGLSAHQRMLSESGPELFRDQVVAEIKDPDRDTVFDHPALAARWLQDLDRLTETTCRALKIAPDHDRFVSDVDLALDRHMPAEQAWTRIGQFRFLAEVHGRKAQAKRSLRRCRDEIRKWLATRDQAAALARDALVSAHLGEYAKALASYDQAKERQREHEAQRVKVVPGGQHHVRKVLPHKAAEFLNRAARCGWDVNIYSPHAVAHPVFPANLVLVAHRGWPDAFPALMCGFRRVARNKSWNTAAITALLPNGRYWVPFPLVADLMQLLDLPDSEIARIVKARHAARNTSRK